MRACCALVAWLALAACGSTSVERPGFVVEELDDGTLWVLRPDTELVGEGVTLMHAGPDRRTIKANDVETGVLYLAAVPGFEVTLVDGRIWVAKPEQPRGDQVARRLAAGPRAFTVVAPDARTLDDYLAALAAQAQ
ncbi:MAG: hypothetical protein AAF628_09170 [Planctomycetota bacterium]